jgi:alkanesulfonate monooxygenase SsuD/methylene tetrahydromethanopterin reductase-like flavin-dependent oxidoreductase (luciferase family)
MPPNDQTRLGLLLTSVYDRSVPADRQIREHHELISLATDIGFDLVCAGQHFAAPSLRYIQPIPYLASLATAFPTLRVATGVVLLPLHHPLAVAEEIATLDALSGGRAICGVGIGYAPTEFDAFGIDRTTRTERFEEAIAIIRALWAGEPLTHHGRHFHLDEVQTSVLPTQHDLPIWIGAQAEPSVRRAGRLADAWYVPPFPTHRELFDLYEMYLEERSARGLEGRAAIPVRRELYLADSFEAAKEMVSAGAASRYGTYSSWGLDLDDGLIGDSWIDTRFVLGDGPAVVDQLSTIAETVPLSDFIDSERTWPAHSAGVEARPEGCRP